MIKMLSQKERELLIRTQDKLHNAKETAEIFRVSVRTVYETIHKYKETGTTELRTSQRGRKSKLTAEDEEHIRELIENNNDITIREIKETLNLNVGDETVRRRVVKMGFRYKKKSLHATERDRSRCGSKKE